MLWETECRGGRRNVWRTRNRRSPSVVSDSLTRPLFYKILIMVRYQIMIITFRLGSHISCLWYLSTTDTHRKTMIFMHSFHAIPICHVFSYRNLYEIVIAISNYLLSECLREIFQPTFKMKQFGVGENATTASLDTRIWVYLIIV